MIPKISPVPLSLTSNQKSPNPRRVLRSPVDAPPETIPSCCPPCGMASSAGSGPICGDHSRSATAWRRPGARRQPFPSRDGVHPVIRGDTSCNHPQLGAHGWPCFLPHQVWSGRDGIRSRRQGMLRPGLLGGLIDLPA